MTANEYRAKIVDGVWKSSRLSHTEKLVAQRTYPKRHEYMREDKRGQPRFSRHLVARRLGIPVRIYDEMIARFARYAREALGD